MKYKIVISEIIEIESPETSYENTKRVDKDGKAIWDYVETGGIRINRDLQSVYTQEVEDLNIGDLACYINRVR